jgi:hypothetical protein
LPAAETVYTATPSQVTPPIAVPIESELAPDLQAMVLEALRLDRKERGLPVVTGEEVHVEKIPDKPRRKMLLWLAGVDKEDRGLEDRDRKI